MFVVHVFVQVKADCIEAFKAATLENAHESINEPGIARFDIVQQLDEEVRSLRAKSAFAKVDLEYNKDEFMKLLVDGDDFFLGKDMLDNQEQFSDYSRIHKEEETRRIVSLTGKVNGKIEDVLSWEM